MGKLNIKVKGIEVNSVHLGIIIIANQFYFETGSFVYHLKVLQVESLKL